MNTSGATPERVGKADCADQLPGLCRQLALRELIVASEAEAKPQVADFARRLTLHANLRRVGDVCARSASLLEVVAGR